MSITGILDAVRGVLTGEPARVIGYGGAVVIYIVAKASGSIPDQSFDQSLVGSLAALAIVSSVVESIRHFVYSPASVIALLAEYADGSPKDV